jgi:NAD-dependent dihydropyrimidine dehydrogenase PreA subunit
MEDHMKYLANVTTLQYMVDKCTGCGRCVEVCPQGVFVMQDKRAKVTDRDLCMECGACARNCDSGALSVDAGVGCASAIITGLLTGTEPTCGCSDTGSSCC